MVLQFFSVVKFSAFLSNSPPLSKYLYTYVYALRFAGNQVEMRKEREQRLVRAHCGWKICSPRFHSKFTTD